MRRLLNIVCLLSVILPLAAQMPNWYNAASRKMYYPLEAYYTGYADGEQQKGEALEITKDGVVFCTLIFNGNGQLTGIAFAPSRNGSHHAPSALMTANGLQFTVTGLNSNTQYGYSVTAKDSNDQTVATYSGEFTTTSEGIATGVEEVSSSLQGGERGRLILHNGQIFILRGEKVYSIDGQEVK